MTTKPERISARRGASAPAHTPGPWTYHHLATTDAFCICGPSPHDDKVADVASEDDAEFIVRACNNYEELLELLREVASFHSQVPLSIQIRAEKLIAKAEGRA